MFTYEYHIKDHLGNVRVTFEDLNNNGNITSNEIKSRNDYYSFGMEWNNRWELSDTISPENLKRYNGKELFSEMNLGHYAYGKRFFDTVLGRFVCTDPISDQFPSLSTYNYASNNPILNIDLHGLQGVNVVAEKIAGNDDEGYIRTATEGTREHSPFTAGVIDATFAVLDYIGLNSIDNAFFGKQKTSVHEKVAAILPVLFNTKGNADEGAKSASKATVKLRESAKTGQEAHRQIQSELKTQGAEIEQSVQLKDRVVRKDAIMPDGTKIIIKPNTPSGKGQHQGEND
ncbi:MAG: RHS repeat-associated core domain-containing protein [Saprospiraceae bacterium]|nr:RHS repeat-associated core domain-containing protein [Saprospiraceae bacterium]